MATDAIRPLTALGLFRAVVTNLDKTNAASFTVEHFNHFAATGQLDYFHERYRLYEESQQLTDDLRAMVAFATYNTTNTATLIATQQCVLPEDYFHAEQVEIYFNPTRNFSAFKANNRVRRVAQKLTADTDGFSNRPNYYHESTYNNPGWRIYGNLLKIESGAHRALQLVEVKFEYLRLPPHITLFESDVEDMTDDNSQVLLWPTHVTYELVKRITALIMEQHGNPRLPVYTQITTAIPNQPTAGGGSAAPAAERAQNRAAQLNSN